MNTDRLIKHLEEIGNSLDEVVGQSLNILDDALREVRKIVKILGADEDFVKLDKLGVLSDDDETDGRKPFTEMIQTLSQEKECNPIGIIDAFYGRIYGLILALEEYKKYSK